MFDPASPTTVLFAGGGTGGHLYPGIAVAEAMVGRWPSVRPVFLCTTRDIDQTILRQTGFDYISQPIQPPVRSAGGLLAFWRSWRETRDLLKRVVRERSPSAVLGLGGYAAGPAVKFAADRKVPALLLNPDVIPGKANQYLLRYAKKVCCQFEATREHVLPSQQDKIIITGCPIRSDLSTLPTRTEAAERLGLNPRLSTLTITGASQGAQTVNDAVLETLKRVQLQGWNVLHLAGRDHATVVREEYRAMDLPAVVIDFTAAMSDVWAVTDLVVSRAGASTCAEVTSCGIASILLPYPYHRDMHQRANARVLSDAGASVLLDDTKNRKSNADQLTPVLTALLSDATRRRQMGENARALGHPQSAEQIAGIVFSVL